MSYCNLQEKAGSDALEKQNTDYTRDDCCSFLCAAWVRKCWVGAKQQHRV